MPPLWAIHRWAALASLVIFLVTGVFMMLAFPSIYAGNEAVRFLYRANHVYILLGGLVNWLVGIYGSPHPAVWRRAVQTMGSVLLLTAPMMLVVAFILEPPTGVAPRPITVIGISILLAGVVFHSAGYRRVAPAPEKADELPSTD
jgi:hypothetical protein